MRYAIVVLALVVGCAARSTAPAAPSAPAALPGGWKALPYPAHCAPLPMQTDTLTVNGHRIAGPWRSFVFDCDGRLRRALADSTPPWYGPSKPGAGW